mmetsp:Transcript_54856/g.151204  ORF Transcript_54856/g.151204 Transcript_54856/m.151204 type:complete len:200 (-) Transcript_54856:90-689(-)
MPTRYPLSCGALDTRDGGLVAVALPFALAVALPILWWLLVLGRFRRRSHRPIDDAAEGGYQALGGKDPVYEDDGGGAGSGGESRGHGDGSPKARTYILKGRVPLPVRQVFFSLQIAYTLIQSFSYLTSQSRSYATLTGLQYAAVSLCWCFATFADSVEFSSTPNPRASPLLLVCTALGALLQSAALSGCDEHFPDLTMR